MIPKKSKYGIANPILILSLAILALVALGITMAATNSTKPQSQNNKQNIEIPSGNQKPISNERRASPYYMPEEKSDEPENIGTYEGVPSGIDFKYEWDFYERSRYHYKVSNPGNWALFINDYPHSDIDLRIKTGDTTSGPGFSIAVIENSPSQTMKEMCEKDQIDENMKITCGQNISSTTSKIGDIEWEKIGGDGIRAKTFFSSEEGLDIVLSTFNDSKLFYIVADGASFDEISTVLETFEFTE